MTSSSFPLSIKWNKQVIDLQFDPAIGPKGLKEELYQRTNVPTSRMKILAKTKGLWKGVLSDATDFNTIEWNTVWTTNKQNPLQLLLMGSAETDSVLVPPKTKTIFLEDLPVEEQAIHAEPAGLINLGNTCYMNSVLQCLRVVPELRQGLRQPVSSQDGNANNNSVAQSNTNLRVFLVQALTDTYNRLDRQTDALPPATLVQAVKMVWPQFNQTTHEGHPMQHDAEEFFSSLLTMLSESGYSKIIDECFGMKLTETLQCSDIAEERPVVREDLHRKLVCNIQGGGIEATNNVNHIAEGILLGLTGEIEKHSVLAGRDCLWKRTQRISRLPTILTVQFGRFYWKATPDSQDHTGVKCKIMKPVAFSDTLDVYDFCSEAIQTILKESRRKALAAEEEAIQKKLQDTDDKNKTDADGDTKMVSEGGTGTTGEGNREEDDLQKALAMSMEPPVDDDADAKIASILGPGIPANFQGYYELFAVVTHKGRDADGGHYMAWVKSQHQDNKTSTIVDSDAVNEDWYVFDDDEVSPCKTEDVLKLKGGGDWHMSYLNFYRVKK